MVKGPDRGQLLTQCLQEAEKQGRSQGQESTHPGHTSSDPPLTISQLLTALLPIESWIDQFTDGCGVSHDGINFQIRETFEAHLDFNHPSSGQFQCLADNTIMRKSVGNCKDNDDDQ